jgi:hypothetical protein
MTVAIGIDLGGTQLRADADTAHIMTGRDLSDEIGHLCDDGCRTVHAGGHRARMR